MLLFYFIFIDKNDRCSSCVSLDRTACVLCHFPALIKLYIVYFSLQGAKTNAMYTTNISWGSFSDENRSDRVIVERNSYFFGKLIMAPPR